MGSRPKVREMIIPPTLFIGYGTPYLYLHLHLAVVVYMNLGQLGSFLHLFQKRTFEDKWDRIFIGWMQFMLHN